MPRRRKQSERNGDRVTGGGAENVGPYQMNALPINQEFAEKYDESKRRQLLSNASAAAFQESEDSSSGSEEDEFGELLTKGIDRRVNETLEAIRKKDPRIYDKDAKFFEDPKNGSEKSDSDSDSEQSSEDEPVAGWNTIAKAAEEGTSKLTLKDYVRESLLKHGKLSDDESEGDELNRRNHDDVEADTYESERLEGSANTNIVPIVNKSDKASEQEELNEVSKNDGSDESDADDFFSKKEKTSTELEAEEKDFQHFLKRKGAQSSRQAGEDLLLHSYLEKETPDEKERFLRDFVLNNGWLDKNAEDAPAAKDYEIEIDNTNPDGEQEDGAYEDDFDDKVDSFEAKHNFRFEDPSGAQIVSHARSIPDSLRRPDDRRKRARDARRLRKEQEKTEKTEEIKRLKNLKKKEVQARLLAIQDAAGDGVDLNGIDLDADFDPDAFNKQMEGKFGDQYYAMEDHHMKQGGVEEMAHASEKPLPSKDEGEISEDIRGDVNRLMDEYYKLDFEDIVAGVPMRFKYKKVEPESFNMTAEDILSTEDKELNRIVALKYLAPYRSRREVQKQAWRARSTLQKRKRAKMPHSEEQDDHLQGEPLVSDIPTVSETGTDSKSGSRRRKRRKVKQDAENKNVETVKHEDVSIGHSEAQLEVEQAESKGEEELAGKRKKKKKRKSCSSKERPKMSEGRMKAYGIEPA